MLWSHSRVVSHHMKSLMNLFLQSSEFRTLISQEDWSPSVWMCWDQMKNKNQWLIIGDLKCVVMSRTSSLSISFSFDSLSRALILHLTSYSLDSFHSFHLYGGVISKILHSQGLRSLLCYKGGFGVMIWSEYDSMTVSGSLRKSVLGHHINTTVQRLRQHYKFRSPATWSVCLMKDLSIYVRTPENILRTQNIEFGSQGEHQAEYKNSNQGFRMVQWDTQFWNKIGNLLQETG